MRILITSTNFYTGGINSFSLALCSSLKTQGFEVIYLATEPFGMLYNNFRNVFDEVKIIRRKFETLNLYFKKLTDFINEKKIDLLINNGVECIQAILPLLNNQTIIFSVIHSIEESELYIGCQNYEYLDSIICVSENIRTEAIRYVPTQKLKVIPVGVEINQNNYTKNDEKLKLVYLGRLTNIAKNLDNLIDISIKLKKRKIDFNLLVIGEGNYSKKLKTMVHQEGLDKFIQFTGALYKDQILEILYQSDIFLLTSEYEGTPNALLEAMAAGVVPIVSNIPGSTDKIIKNGENGFLCEINDTDEFVKNIIYLKNNTNDYKIISRHAKLTVEENYNVNNIAKIYLSLFETFKGLININNKILVGKFIIAKRLRIYCKPLNLQIKRMLGDMYRNIFKGIKPIRN